MKITWALVLIFLLAFGFYTAAQESGGSRRIPTVEELYLRHPSLAAVMEKATSTDRDTKLLALDDIEEMIETGNMGKDEGDGVYDMLTILSAEGTSTVRLENHRLVNNFPIVRRRAVELMGRMARESADDDRKQGAIDSIILVLERDDEVMVKSEAAYALGVIGDDKDGKIVRMLAEIIARQSTVAPDNNFAYAVTLAIDKIAKENNGIKDYRGYTALVTIMQGNYTRKVKDKAFEVLQSLKNYR